MNHRSGLTVTEDGRIFNGERELKTTISNGYKRIRFKYRTYRVHRLVAECFIPNPLGLPQVNHKDGNKANNHSSNLEWVSASDNIKHDYRTGHLNKPIKVMRNDGRMYKSIREAANDIGVNPKCVWSVINGFQKTTGGYSFIKSDMP